MPTHADHFTAAIDAFNAGDADRFVELFEGGSYVVPAIGRRDKDADLRRTYRGWRTAMPDMRAEIASFVGEGDGFAAEVIVTGTHDGPFVTIDGREIPASGNAIEQRSVMVGRYENGTLASLTHYFDVLSLFRQMGAA